MAAEHSDKDKAPEPIEASVACSVDFNGIITALHEKALSQLNDEAYTIQNSAIDGEGKDAKFYGAGSHIIAAIPKENKGLDKNKIPKDVALQMIQTYVQWFVGPDLKTGVTDKDLIPLENEDSGKVEDTHLKKQDIEKSRGSAEGSKKVSTASKEKYKESFEIFPSFSEYLLLEEGPEASSEGSPDASGDSGADSNGSSRSAASGSSGSASGTSGSASGSSDSESASGYYIAYQLDIKPGEKGKPLADALKKMGADLLKGFGIRVGSWRSGSSGDAHTIGDLMNSLDAVFGKIDLKELESEYGKEMAKRFKDGDYQAKVIDTKTIIKHLNKQLAGSDKSKIKAAEMALCTKVNKKDKSYKLYSKQVIADSVTAAIQGIFKKFKNRVTAKDVILVNNYSDNKKSKGEVKYTEKGEGSVEDSLVVSFPGRIITEALSVEDRRKSIKQKLEELAKKNLGDSYKKSDALPSTEVIEILKKNGIDEPKLFSQLQDAQNSFYICTTADVESETTKESIAVKSMLKMLFEASGEDLTASVKKAFTDLVFSFKDYLPKGKEISEKAIGNVQELIAKDPTESMKQQFGLISQIFEDMSFDEYGVILEAGSHTAAHINEIIDRVGAKNIIASKDKIITAAKEAYSGTSDIDKAIKQELIGKKAKTKEVKWDAKRAKGWNKKHPDDEREAGYVEKVKVGEDQPGIFDEFFKLSDDESMKAFVNKTFDDVSKDEDKERIVQGFWKCLDLAKLPDREPEDKEDPKKPEPPDPLPEEVKELKIGFLDRNPESNELDDPEYISAKVGGSVTPPKPKYESDKHKFNGWRDQNGVLGDFDNIRDPKSYTAEYAHEIELDKFLVTFQDFNPDTGEITEIESQEVSKGGAAKEPKVPEHEGWKFKEWTQPFDNVTASIETMTLWDPDIKLIPKAPKDPSKSTEDLEPIGDPISYDPKKPIKEQLPELPERDGWEPDGWDPDPESIKDPKEDIEIIGKYKKKGTGSKKQKVSYWVIPDENGLLDEVKIKFDIKLVNPDPEDPDNTGSWKDIALVHVIDGKYKVDDLKAMAKSARPTEADELSKAAEENEKAFKAVENIMKMESGEKPYKFLGWTTDENGSNPTFEKKEIQEVIDELIRSGKAPEDDEVTMRAVWSNDIKAVHTELDFYIVPMKGLKDKEHYDNATGRTVDG